MEKIYLNYFYNLGASLNPQTRYTPEARNRLNIIMICPQAQMYVRNLLNYFLDLTVCRDAGGQLLLAIEEVDKWYRNTQPDKFFAADPSADLTFKKLIDVAKVFETVLIPELQTLATYYARQKGIYSTPDLIDNAEKVLPITVLERISTGVIEEIRQSGRCLAFDNATSSGFHIMRATEAVMHEYYLHVCKPRPKPAGRLENWGAYLTEFKKTNKAEVKEVVAILQQIKDRHRNLIMHPEIVLTPDEAFMLFEIAQGAIIAMANAFPKKK